MNFLSGLHRYILLVASMLFLSACGAGKNNTNSNTAPTLSYITISPSNPTTAVNSRLQLTAIGTYSDKSSKDITASVSWLTSNSTVASIGASNGLLSPAQGAAPGQTAVITAISGTLSASTTLTLTSLSTFTLTNVTDPLAAQQWNLKNTGQNGYADTTGSANTTGLTGSDINVEPVYSTYGYTGYGVTIGVVDSGLEITHEDLKSNVIPNGSWNFATNTTDPTNTASTTGDHGTMISGMIAMAKNGIGGMGVAPSAQLKAFNILSPYPTYTATIADEIASLGGSSANPNSTDVQIFNQSFGTENTVDMPGNAFVEAQYASGTSTLRGGKGALYVKASGNGYYSYGTASCTSANTLKISCQNSNFDPDNTLPYNIVVAALNANGLSASYSSAGSSIWISAPGGETGYNYAAMVATGYSPLPATTSVAFEPAMITTDQSGCTLGQSVNAPPTSTSGPFSYFNQGGSKLSGVNLNCNYTNTMNGTSSATPMVSGVIALMLEANPKLTWREVKDILARTAIQVDATNTSVVNITTGMTGASVAAPFTAEQGWVTNAAGFKFHNWYGFGAINANAAVSMARTYTSGSLGIFSNSGWISSGTLNLAIPDNNAAGVSSSLTVPAVGTSGKVETVQLKVTTSSTACDIGDIGIELTSPSGTKSILKNIQDGFSGKATSTGLAGMVLASNAFYGEMSAGTWTVRVIDGRASLTQTLTNVAIRVYGH